MAGLFFIEHLEIECDSTVRKWKYDEMGWLLFAFRGQIRVFVLVKENLIKAQVTCMSACSFRSSREHFLQVKSQISSAQFIHPRLLALNKLLWMIVGFMTI